MLRSIPLLLALSACNQTPADDPLAGNAAAVDPFAGAPNVVFDYYPVTGRDVRSIRASIAERRPTDDRGKRFAAVTNWHISWHWDGDGQGGCRLATTRTDFSASVRMPRLEPDQVPAAVVADWRRYDAALARHEAGHVRIAYQHLGDVEAAIRNATCATADSAGHAALDRIRQANRDYDSETRHGELQGAVFPSAD
ncbi:MAG: DUF922 domain-containing protein [Sphingomonas sp.]|jgi:predicted secreted Zn-dependent protease|uniref:DUF922 domain-containing protein n=1 Tax=Sphingomonas sp. TaxID=28214 RepID=UPI00356373EE